MTYPILQNQKYKKVQVPLLDPPPTPNNPATKPTGIAATAITIIKKII